MITGAVIVIIKTAKGMDLVHISEPYTPQFPDYMSVVVGENNQQPQIVK
jgi:hypothetical protein